MTAYNFEGSLVDLKGFNDHDSALVAAQVSGGRVVTFAADSTKIQVATSGQEALGVAIQDRASGDSRPLTYTFFGEVNLIAATTVVPGDILEVQNSIGEVGPVAIAALISSSGLKSVMGRSLASGSSGQFIRSHIGGLVI